MKERCILHSDANCFYASVEAVLNPELRGKAVAVCGSTEERHGIVLAKSEKAKKAGVKTGMANWQAKECCKDLIIVPPRYEYYMKFSKYLHSIYQRYTDLVELFGMDECWLDVTNTLRDGMEVAEEIRQTVKDELGITVSIGVSFNKIFAKLGSDMKKPDAVTQISRDDYKAKVWPLPCEELLYCGRATTAKLNHLSIKTIGDIARVGPEFMGERFGKNGVALWKYASGNDTSRVAHQDFTMPAKSVGHGITCVADLENMEEVRMVLIALAQDIGHRLRVYHLKAKGVQVYIRDSRLCSYLSQAQLEYPTQSEASVSQAAIALVEKNYAWTNQIRAITISAINLVSESALEQTTIFCDYKKVERQSKLERTVDNIRGRYGKTAIAPAVLMNEHKMPPHSDREIIMPGIMHK